VKALVGRGRLFRSLTARLALLLAAVFVAVLSGIGAFLYVFLDNEMRERDRMELEGKLELVRHFVGQARSQPDMLAHVPQLRDALLGHERLHVVLLDAAGNVLFASSGATAEPELIGSGRTRIAAGTTGPYLVKEGTELRATTGRVSLADPAQPALWAIIALETTENQELLATYLRSLVVTLLIGAVLAALASLLAIRHGLAPVARIARTAEQVSASRLERHIPLEDTPTELTGLVQSFNGMLARLADSFRRLSEFSADLAHELRTPLHSLLGHAQVALSRARAADEYRLVLESIVEEGERLARTVRDMLFLAQADNASLVLDRQRVDLKSEVDAVVSFFQALSEERGIQVTADGAGSVMADRNMVQRAVSNLLSNALRHTAPGGTVKIQVEREGDDALILISNTGAPIPPERLPRIFDRFYRADDSRSDETGGTGLGLAIVKSIMDLHRGKVEAESTPGRLTTFRLRFPGAQEQLQRRLQATTASQAS
jgi:two-component system heavy metal sensor histidine kinase CusS